MQVLLHYSGRWSLKLIVMLNYQNPYPKILHLKTLESCPTLGPSNTNGTIEHFPTWLLNEIQINTTL
jgi:hypothetical protein